MEPSGSAAVAARETPRGALPVFGSALFCAWGGILVTSTETLPKARFPRSSVTLSTEVYRPPVEYGCCTLGVTVLEWSNVPSPSKSHS